MLLFAILAEYAYAQPIEIYRSSIGIKRQDSNNPYCPLCITLFNRQPDPFGEDTKNECTKLVPMNSVSLCNYLYDSLKRNEQTKKIQFGCIDKTLKDNSKKQWGALMCPGLVACNIIESGTGGPICGPAIRAWGDFLPMFVDERTFSF